MKRISLATMSIESLNRSRYTRNASPLTRMAINEMHSQDVATSAFLRRAFEDGAQRLASRRNSNIMLLLLGGFGAGIFTVSLLHAMYQHLAH